MTPEAQRVAIAEACGAKWYRWGAHEDAPLSLCMPADWLGTGSFVPATRKLGEEFWADGVPDYLNDLNAMHEARKVLTPDQQVEYSVQLGKLTTSHLPARCAAWMDYKIADAEAFQHAEAFLKALNLWEEKA